MTRIAIISDTHIPSRATSIPEWVVDQIKSADHTIHAGDFDSEDAYETVRELAGSNLTAVRGNMDPLDLPRVETITVENVTFVVTHGTGSTHDYEERVAEIVRENRSAGTTVGVSGHTHEVMDTEVGGIRLLNPGSATAAAPATRETMMAATVEDGELSVTVHEG